MTERVAERTRRIAIALSGGGHRASLFGLGVLLYLADAGRNRDVMSVSSVSGGSLANAWLAQRGDYSNLTPEELESRIVGPLLDGWRTPVHSGRLGLHGSTSSRWLSALLPCSRCGGFRLTSCGA